MTSGLGAVVTYALLAALWGLVVVVYARQWPSTRGERTVRLLLAFLIAEAARTFLESVYFGLLWGANYGVLPEMFKALGAPVFLSSVKGATVVLGVVVLVGVARVWLPTELAQRRTQRDAEEALRRQLEESLREARERESQLALAAQASRDGLWEDDLRTRRLTMSPRFWEMMGLPPGDPSAWNRHVHPEDRERVREAYLHYLEGSTPNFDVRYRFIRPDGRQLHFHAHALMVRDEKGAPTRLVGFTRDITADVEAEEARVQTQKLEGLGVLAGGLAHDFNNLLTVVKSSLSVIEQQAKTGENVDDALGTAQQAVTRASVLTRQLSAYAGRTTLSQHPLDLNQVVQGIGELLSVSMARGVTLEQQLSPSLPGVLGDDGQVQQVVMNLITNAAEAIGEGVGTVTLRTEALVLEQEPAGARSPMPKGPRGVSDRRRHGLRHDARGDAAHVRPLLHDARRGARAGPGGALGHSAQARRRHRGAERSGPGHYVSRVLSRVAQRGRGRRKAARRSPGEVVRARAAGRRRAVDPPQRHAAAGDAGLHGRRGGLG
ncbi:MAG: hypothetical protein DI536_07845 [Archangium gephyra]|uniref:histidine kinase n=1 Tax=Archangium gephyra TaxID=48 RepID=A0A2W5V1M1_9BACT|nr:MAG: hypothetical protein DI536_07845 [Archangium gephyra]